MNKKELLHAATTVMNNAYVKYSNFKVGAALLTKSGRIFTGCNVENSSYSATICAERVAFTKAISEGESEFEAIAIVNSSDDFAYPCGICRQFMSEFGLDLKIFISNDKELREHTLKELLPFAFTEFKSGT